jgi:3-dehydroquinate dehydratase type I
MIIVAITGPALEDARAQLRVSSRYADMVEFRLDMMQDVRRQELTPACRRPWIATCRPKREGGAYTGGEEERLHILGERAGAAFVDIELDAVREFRRVLAAMRST